MRVIVVAGARPNFMKVKPVVDGLEARSAEVILVHTGQHYDDSMSGVFFQELNLRKPDRCLEVGSGTHAEQTAGVLTAFEPVVTDLRPDVVAVVGDVNSTLACALVGAKFGCLVAHVEAGLRSRDWSMPEEINRAVVDRVSDYLFAPSDDAVTNLRAEGYRDDQVYLVGNVMIDTLLANFGRAMESRVLEELNLSPRAYGLVTLHRPSNVDDPHVLGSLLDALGEISQCCPLVFPAHPRTAARLASHTLPPGIRLIPPAAYLDFIRLEASAQIVLTDSGGVQEETTALGIPCLTLRNSTERPITVSEGTNQVVGIAHDKIIAAAGHILENGIQARRPALWDGHAGGRIADVLMNRDELAHHGRPTAI